MRKITITILGSTGTIGQNTLDLVRKNRKLFKVVGMSAYSNVYRLKKQIEEFEPQYAAIGKNTAVIKSKKTKIFKGKTGLIKLAQKKVDILVVGISGLAALRPLVEALPKSRKILLANKEVMIACGPLLKKKFGPLFKKIFPLDSELFSLWLLLHGLRRQEVEEVYLTASGGPFLRRKKEEIDKASLKEVLQHPNWVMGKKISVDSATLMNKGFEVIETKNMFGLPLEKIKVLIHPQSFVHALVRTKAGIILGAMFYPDMRVPIGYGLGVLDGSSFFKNQNMRLPALNFQLPDHKKFPALSLCQKAAKKGRSFPLALVAADEEAVGLYLKGRITLAGIYKIVKGVLERHSPIDILDWQKVEEIEAWARQTARALAKRGLN